MPSSHRKKRSVLFDKSPKILGEVTLNDYANSEVPKGSKGRIKKSVSNEIMIACKSIEDDPTVTDEEAKLGRRRRRRKSSSGSSKEDNVDCRPGKVYPLDLWFLLSEYIRPRDILTFSLICRGSYHVVNTSKFWINLFKRYCRTKRVAKRFGPECLERHHGLKPTVVQALVLACPSLGSVNKVHDPNSVSGFLCILMWIERTGLNDIQDSVTINSPVNWIYKFKMSKKEYWSASRTHSSDKKLRNSCDINANPDEGCKILAVPCCEYTAVPCVSGMRLSKITSSKKQLSLSLEFSSAPLNSSKSQMGNISIRLRPSQSPTVFDWWHPSYHISQALASKY